MLTPDTDYYGKYAQWLADEGIESISLNPDSVIETWKQLAGQ